RPDDPGGLATARPPVARRGFALALSVKRLTASSFAKINLGLRVLGRLPDGYHEVRTTLQTIDLADEIRFQEAARVTLTLEGSFPAPADGSNLVLRAAAALQERYPGRGAEITLVKRIPPEAGLGGGSSNAAVTLMGLDRLWDLQADPGLLYALAARLGSDVPFFLYGGRCLALGRGDEILPLPDGVPWGVVVAWPGVGLSTRQVYEGLPLSLTRGRILSSMKGFVPVPPGRRAETTGALAGGPPARGAEGRSPGQPPDIDNDLEQVAFGMLPALRRLRERLLERGAVAAALTGSGSAVYGLFRDGKDGRRLGEIAASLATGGAVAYPCRTLTRDAYRDNLFERSRT
ncbi:MAG TPA: 4-(cytidine 5'-diphospho)-2-C-methyl-D-erythritol kinase, partial [Candidatus Polarisedimenticolia bacterium]|nr:4-(cytidine 5'-diphospho)-2-C-methyl-D-erythritol kinase [Candidatus Polarisedimenticolia bacterium]